MRAQAGLATRGLLLFSLAALACGPGAEPEERAIAQPVPLENQEDAVCGMTVRDQSAPRAQVIHNDGERAFFCSLGDLLVHLSAPSPHGRARRVYVEVMRPDEDPLQPHTGPHPWLGADEAVYVVGVDRPGIMGAPVLAYASAADAQQVADAHPGARVVDLVALEQWWTGLQEAR